MGKERKKRNFRDNFEKFPDLKDQEDRGHIRGANNHFLSAVKKIREENGLGDRAKMTFNHIKALLCPGCGSDKIIKDGWIKNDQGEKAQSHKCKGCGRKFSVSSSGGLSRVKMSTATIVQLIKTMVYDDTYKDQGRNLLISEKTAIYWRKMMFLVAHEFLDAVMLGGEGIKVVADEKYVKSNEKDVLEKIRLRGSLRGLSKDQRCIILAVDEKGRCFGKVAQKKGKVGAWEFSDALRKHIANKSVLVDDGEKAHDSLIKELELVSERHIDPHKTKKGAEAMLPVDDLCSYLESKLRKHRGIKTKNLDDYVAWFLFVKTMLGIYRYKAYRVVGHMMIEEKKLLKFRDIFRRKNKK